MDVILTQMSYEPIIHRMANHESEAGLTSEQAYNLLSDEDQKSVDILKALQDSYWFALDEDDKNVVKLYNRDQFEGVEPGKIKFPVDDFLNAVDYYFKNRGHEIAVNFAMQKPDGVVDIYSPHVEGVVERHVVASLKNYFVPQLLEFAYLIVRSSQKK